MIQYERGLHSATPRPNSTQWAEAALDQVRALNQKIAGDYSVHIYDIEPISLLGVERLFGQAALFGEVGRPADVLDLGCGTGAQLCRIAEQVSGRVVGTDISPEPARVARERLSRFGDRAEVFCADLLETEAESLGQFDLILNIGVIYMTPPAVQRRILDLIGQCLRPGGVALISYYAGSLPAVRANLHRLLRAGLDGLPPADALASARTRAGELAEALANTPDTEFQRAALEATTAQSDLVLYHELFNPCFGAMQTSAVARDLADFGLEFAWYLSPSIDELSGTSLDRSIAADMADFICGNYRGAVFARYLNTSGPCNVTTDQVCWESTLTRENPGQFAGDQAFTQVGDTGYATMRAPVSIAMLDGLTEQPLDWAELVRWVSRTIHGQEGRLSDDELALMEVDMRLLWRHGLLKPIYRSD